MVKCLFLWKFRIGWYLHKMAENYPLLGIFMSFCILVASYSEQNTEAFFIVSRKRGDYMLLKAMDLLITAGPRTLLEIDELEIYEGDKIGLIGKNGTGKTTLLQVLADFASAEKGTIERYGKIDFIPQLKEANHHKSGGELTQQYIQKAFSSQSGLLLADEPTTHLDTKHIEWLEQSLSHWHGAYVIISHDRAFLDQVCTQIWEINEQKLRMFNGNYIQYKEQKEKEERSMQQRFEKYAKKKLQLEQALDKKRVKANRATKKPKKTSHSEAKITGAKPYFAKKQKKLHQNAKSIETRLKKLEKVEKPFEEKPLKMELPYHHKLHNKTVIQADQLSGNIGNRLLWEKATFFIKAGEKVAVVGPNGSGKTTLINKILNNSKGITVSSACRIGHFKQDLSLLDEKKSILENVQEGSLQTETMIRIVLARLGFKRADVHKKVGVLSGGERVKVSLAKIFVSNSNTLLLDEPTNFLDIEAMEALEKLLMEYEGTLLFVSHDRMFVEKIATKTIAIENGQLSILEGTRKDNKHAGEKKQDHNEEELLRLETKISAVLGKLSTEPTPELEEEYQQLVKQKQQLQ